MKRVVEPCSCFQELKVACFAMTCMCVLSVTKGLGVENDEERWGIPTGIVEKGMSSIGSNISPTVKQAIYKSPGAAQVETLESERLELLVIDACTKRGQLHRLLCENVAIERANKQWDGWNNERVASPKPCGPIMEVCLWRRYSLRGITLPYIGWYMRGEWNGDVQVQFLMSPYVDAFPLLEYTTYQHVNVMGLLVQPLIFYTMTSLYRNVAS